MTVQAEGGRVRPYLAQVLAHASGVALDFGSVCDLDARIPAGVERAIFDHMSSRGERFSIIEFFYALGSMVQLAIDRGYGDVALEHLSRAEWQAAQAATLTTGVEDVLQACLASRRPIVLIGGNSIEVMNDLLVRNGLRRQVGAVIGRDGGIGPSISDAVQCLGMMSSRVAFVSDRCSELAWAKEDGLLCLAVEGHDSRKHLSGYGPVVGSMRKLAEAIESVPVGTCMPLNGKSLP